MTKKTVVAKENMSDINQLYMSALQNVRWQDPSDFVFATHYHKQWLLEQGSLSRRLEQHCQALTVSLLENQVVPVDSLSLEEQFLIGEHECLRRQVILQGDLSSWVFGRTLIPVPSLKNQQYDLVRQGNIPLGLTVFSAEKVRRDALQVGLIETELGPLFARRSRLWMNEKPMLVAELFLPQAPIYTKETV